MTAGRAFEDQCVLTELIAKFLDMKSARHAANCCDTSQMRPFSNSSASTLYKEYAAARQQTASPTFSSTARDLPGDYRLNDAICSCPN
jgi:hypothetical protein